MNQRWEALQQRINGLNQRERLLVMLTAMVVVAMFLYVLLVEPLVEKRQSNQRQLKEIAAQLNSQQSEKTILEAELQAGVNRQKQRQRDQLKEEVAALDQQIQQSVVAMIPPDETPQVLEQLLLDSKGLKLLGLENHPVATLVGLGELGEVQTGEQQGGEQAAQAQQNQTEQGEPLGLYKHSFTLRLSGDYLSVLDYFEKLAKLPWHFHWDALNYQVDEYPNAVVELEVHTVSMSEEWIGV